MEFFGIIQQFDSSYPILGWFYKFAEKKMAMMVTENNYF